MTAYFKYDLPCFQPKMVGTHKLWVRYFLLGYMHYELSNVEDLGNGSIYFELHDEEGLIGVYTVSIDNWSRIVELEKNLVESETNP